MAFFAPIVIFFQFFLQTGNSLIIFAADFKIGICNAHADAQNLKVFNNYA